MNERDFSFGIIPINTSSDAIKVLLVKGKDSGVWSFPKGHKEGTESDVEAARREFVEETGIADLEIWPEYSFFERYNVEKRGKLYDKTVKYFIGLLEMHDPVIPVHEIGDCKWFSPDEALEILYSDQNQKNLLQAMGIVQDRDKNKN